ncbi:REP-associated tyrosine transposase [Azotobacter beijerinckii]|uniref:REP element-mobilizing transposase RayT n=1 Tax=Azotobacter beijerinckii TaxID=170623 RepID=A0A1I4J3F3_9GAMM|nr:transposase [Azotobacter beijerinckii]SFB65050.1 REP element-mobilizing transposase RayT [Azotobacter beijerinckii]SFL61094.1 REP element-mobilizing transposase RayT [Azotobacter beijerinckii]
MDSSHFAHRGHALRRGRISEPGRLYLLTAITQHRKKVFYDWQAARLLIGEMRELHEQAQVRSLAWVVMPDHLHWLVELGPLPLAPLMQRLKSRSAIAINKASANSTGRLWQKGFHDHALRREEAVLDVARYVVANPLRAGLVARLGDYPHWDAVWL